MIDADKIISDALASAQAELTARVAARANVIARLQVQRGELDELIATLQAMNADDQASVATVEAKAISVGVAVKL